MSNIHTLDLSTHRCPCHSDNGESLGYGTALAPPWQWQVRGSLQEPRTYGSGNPQSGIPLPQLNLEAQLIRCHNHILQIAIEKMIQASETSDTPWVETCIRPSMAKRISKELKRREYNIVYIVVNPQHGTKH